jgi:hypothetical protein
MLPRMALLLIGLWISGATTATEKPRPAPSFICPNQTALARVLAVHGAFAGPSGINPLIVNVIDDNVPQVRQQLDGMDPADATRWRQSALITAAYAGDPVMVAALLDDGALIDGQGVLPALDGKFRIQLMAEVEKDPKWTTFDADPKTARDLDALLMFDGRLEGPALNIAAQCGDLATLDVALSHHANLRVPRSTDVLAMAVIGNNPAVVIRLLDDGADPSHAPDNSKDGLSTAIVEGNAAMVTLLLDHGTNSCAEYRSRQRRFDAFQSKHQEQKRRLDTNAEIGRRENLPDGLVARLTCPEFDKSGPSSP